MALYVSCGTSVLVAIRAEEPKTNNKGDIIGKHPRLFAQFQRGVPADWAVDDAVAKLNFSGVGGDLTPRDRMGTFDSIVAQQVYGWTDEERKIVEDGLDAMQGVPAQFVRVERPKIAPPWPAIDEMKPHGRRTVEIATDNLFNATQTFGIDPDLVTGYLSQEGWDQRIINGLNEMFARANASEDAEELVAA